VRNTGLQTKVLNQRIEKSDPQNADLITARALAPLYRLLPLAYRHLSPGGRCLFLKGAQYQEELDAVASGWQMTTDIHPSVTSPNSVILNLSEISHAKS
jgi:16S rRNA (guanine527-N7)-methyltransferase